MRFSVCSVGIVRRFGIKAGFSMQLYQALSVRAVVQFRLGHNDQAVKDYSEAIRFTDANWLVRRAELYEAANNTNAAVADYRRAVGLMPNTVATRALRRLKTNP